MPRPRRQRTSTSRRVIAQQCSLPISPGARLDYNALQREPAQPAVAESFDRPIPQAFYGQDMSENDTQGNGGSVLLPDESAWTLLDARERNIRE
mmetsp:Transcript_1403/g.3113  ORF Transcript_1403/g.3113 Transcript_1403/m.3113 type:complete len:94 (+) Transcript_1403:174-455(+)